MNQLFETIWNEFCKKETNDPLARPDLIYFSGLIEQCHNELLKTISKDEQLLLRKYDAIYQDFIAAKAKDAFIKGFSAGVQLIIESWINAKEESKGKKLK